MRKWLLVLALLIVAGLGYAISPFASLYWLGSSLQSLNIDDALSRVNVVSVRRSIIRQVLEDGAQQADLDKKIGALNRRIAIHAASVSMDGQISQLITPEVLWRLISGRSLPAGLPGGANEPAEASGSTGIGIPEKPLEFMRGWDFKSLTKFEVTLGSSTKIEDETGLVFRIEGFSWKLTEVRLPSSLIAKVKPIIQEKLGQG